MSPVTLLRCRQCGRYTLRQGCPSCGAPTDRPGPARYSPEDRYGTYRRALRRATAREEGPSAGKQEEA